MSLESNSKNIIFTGRYDDKGELTITYTAEFSIDGRYVSGCGCGRTLDEARSGASQSAILFARKDTYGRNDDNHPSQNVSKEDINGGYFKPISEKQQSFISSMASEVGINAEKESRALFDKPLSALNGSEAHQLIQNLKLVKGKAYAI